MVLRLRLTPRDLDRVSIADAPAPVLELSNHARVDRLLSSPEWRNEVERRGLHAADLAQFSRLYGGACSPGFLHPSDADPPKPTN